MKFFPALQRAVMTMTMVCCIFSIMAQKRLFVFSDPHLLAPELFQVNSSALQNNLASDSRMFDLSHKIMQSMVNTILDEHPDAILIPGDLTKQGEKLSHIAMATYLKQVTDAGIKVFVIPGNHDVNNKQAVGYDGDNTYTTPTVSSSEFADLYKDMGYAVAIERDNNSLSYVAEPVPGLRLIAVDDSRCTARDNNTNLSANGLSTDTRTWICNQMDSARQHNKQVLVMMHHNIIEHIDDQDLLTSDALVAQAQEIRNEMVQHGAHIVLTGHMHVSNITTWRNDALTDSIVEISTGSAIAYPCHYRIIELSPDLSTFQVSTASITKVEGTPNFIECANQRMAGSARATIRSLINHNWEIFDSKMQQYQSVLGGATFTKEEVTQCAYRNMESSVIELNKTMGEGNENEKDGQAIRNRLNTSVSNFANDLLSKVNVIIRMGAILVVVSEFNQMTDAVLNSALNDCTNYGTELANVTDDLHPTLYFSPVKISVDDISGDVNGDNKVDVEDVNAIINIILELKDASDYSGNADLNNDSKVDVEDVNAAINIILSN